MTQEFTVSLLIASDNRKDYDRQVITKVLPDACSDRDITVVHDGSNDAPAQALRARHSHHSRYLSQRIQTE